MDVLAREQAALDRFIDLLQQEQTALVDANVDDLQRISEDKQKQSEQLNDLARQRMALLQGAGFATDRAGVQAWLAQQSPAVQDIWQKLLDSAQAAQHLNQTNGTLIQTHLEFNQRALIALMQAANVANVYGEDGQPQAGPGTGGRSIGKA